MKFLHLELKIRYKEYFESKLAQFIFGHIELLRRPIDKISQQILALLLQNKTAIINEINNNPKVNATLFDPNYLGHLSRNSNESAKIFDQITSSLNSKSFDIYTIMHIHNTFIHRLYDCINTTVDGLNQKAKLVATLFPNDYFSESVRPRNKINESLQISSQLGITRNPVYSKMIPQGPLHVKGYSRYQFSGLTLFEKNANAQSAPFVCGPSGNAGSLLLGASLYGNLSADEIQIYSLVCFSFLALAGCHSFSEVMMIAKLIGITYQEDSYLESIPADIQTHQDFQKLSSEFNQFL